MTNTISVLIVDDEPTIRNGLVSIIDWNSTKLSLLGTATNGEEALSLIEKLRPHIVITDIRMPIKDGLNLIGDVRQRGYNTKFIILSGYDDFSYAQQAIRYNVNSYLLKPVQPNELNESLVTLRDEILQELANMKKHHNTRQQLLIHNMALKENFYNKLLENEYRKADELEKHFYDLQIPLEMKPIRVLIFAFIDSLIIHDPNSLAIEKDPSLIPINPEIDEHLIRDCIDVIDQVFTAYQHLVFSKDSHEAIMILNTDDYLDNELEHLRELSSRVVQSFKNSNHSTLNISIGDEFSSPLFTKNSLVTAREALSYNIYGTGEFVFDSSVISDEPSPIIKPKNKFHSEIIDAIYLNDHEEIDRLLYEFFHSLFYVSTPKPNYIRGMCIYMMIDIQKGLTAFLDSDNTLFKDVPYAVINRLNSFRDIRSWITSKFYAYADYLQLNSPYKKDPTIQKAKTFIHDNIYKKLKAEDVAEHIGFSENYFTVYFKDKTNENFKNYLQRMKMEKAKEHLKTSDILISELSSMLGYEDYRSLNRAFKKETGLTPSEYQHKYRGSGK